MNERSPDFDSLSDEEKLEWLRSQVDDWDGFMADIQQSLGELAAHRADGRTDFPPGWVTLDEVRARRGARRLS